MSKSHTAPLLEIATDLAANLAASDRYGRLLSAIRQVVPYDAAAILRLVDGVLIPVATRALTPETLGRRFHPEAHPRLNLLLHAHTPVRFTGTHLPDPFDGLVEDHADALSRVHACMGAPLRVNGEVIGVLSLDALDPHAFDAIDDGEFALLAGLAAAAMRTAGLIEALEASAAKHGLVAKQLMSDAKRREGELVGRSHAMKHLRDEIALLATSDLTALITGETGVGKELVAHAIHDQSARRGHPLVHLNCAALPESIAESELFGHVRGAFTGADESRAGRFEVADGGTLFLDEIGELPLTIQPKLLRALQSGEIQRVGADHPTRVNVRVIAATNRNLVEAVRTGRFRIDLYHRLSVYPLSVPPLRERGDDILLLAGWFLDRARIRLGLGPVRLSADARLALQHYTWPGNVRELEHLMLRAAIKAAGHERDLAVLITAAHLDLPVGAAPTDTPSTEAPATALVSWHSAMDQHARHLIEQALAQGRGNWSEAARLLQLDRSNLYRLAKRLGLVTRSHPKENATS